MLVSVGDQSAPSAPGLLSAAGAVGQATLSWGAANDNVGVVRYNVHRGTSAGFTPSVANRIAQPAGLSYVDQTSPGSYFYRVTAEDAAGNIGPASNEAAATVTSDTTAPTAPANLSAPVTGSTANLTWTASSDNVGVVRYNLHRGSTSGFTPTTANRIAQPTGTSHADSGLATGTYYYKVTAEDAAGNLSPSSNQATATVADATPPTAPSNLTATPTGSTVNLSWTAATDNVAVTHYNLHRGTTSGFTPTTANRIAQPTGTSSHSDSGLAPGTYFYKATAEDAAGNIEPRLEHGHRHCRGHDRAHQPPPASPPTAAPARPHSAGPPPPTTSPSRATTSTAPPPAASPPPPPTESRNPPARATTTPDSPPAPTTTRSRPKTPPATSAHPPHKPPQPSPPHPSPDSSPPTASTKEPARAATTNPAPATTPPSRIRAGPDPPQAVTATPSRSTAPPASPRSPTPPASTSPPA